MADTAVGAPCLPFRIPPNTLEIADTAVGSAACTSGLLSKLKIADKSVDVGVDVGSSPRNSPTTCVPIDIKSSRKLGSLGSSRLRRVYEGSGVPDTAVSASDSSGALLRQPEMADIAVGASFSTSPTKLEIAETAVGAAPLTLVAKLEAAGAAEESELRIGGLSISCHGSALLGSSRLRRAREGPEIPDTATGASTSSGASLKQPGMADNAVDAFTWTSPRKSGITDAAVGAPLLTLVAKLVAANTPEET